MMNNAIQITGLTKIFKRENKALNGVNLSIPEGSIFAVVGPNGAGKTTLFNIIAGIMKKNEGSVQVMGEEIEYNSFEYKRHMGFSLERAFHIEKLTIEEYLHFVAVMYEVNAGDIQARINELTDFFELGNKRKERMEHLSKGMKKKVSLAVALIHQPRILILDEPLDGIDTASIAIIKKNLKLMSKSGITVVMSSHHLTTIEEICTHIAILKEGEIIFQSELSDLIRKMERKQLHSNGTGLEDFYMNILGENSSFNKKLSWLN